MPANKSMKQINETWAEHFGRVYAAEPRILVNGDGPIKAKIALIGEAPGKEETMQQRPFVGKAGKNLDEFLQMTGLERDALYITNVVKFRPVRISAKGTAANRPPTAEEIALFLPWLKEEIERIGPKWIVTLGNVPLKALTGAKSAIGQLHGAAYPAPVWGAALFPLYHPASIIYNRSLRPIYEQDLAALKALLEG